MVGKSFCTLADGFTFVPALLAAFLLPQAGRTGLADLPPASRLLADAALSGNGLPGPLGVLALGFAGSVASRALAFAFPNHLEPLVAEEADALPVSFVVTRREARGEACSVAAGDRKTSGQGKKAEACQREKKGRLGSRRQSGMWGEAHAREVDLAVPFATDPVAAGAAALEPGAVCAAEDEFVDDED